jgi:hypothetical protein
LGTAVCFEIEEGDIEGSGVDDLFMVGRGSFVGCSKGVYEREGILWGILSHNEVAVSGIVRGKSSTLGKESKAYSEEGVGEDFFH